MPTIPAKLTGCLTDQSLLVVEDEALARYAMKRLLEARGFTVLAVGSAEEALDILVSRTAPPAVMVVDVDLPGMCGLDLILHVQTYMPGIHAVLVTAADRATVARFAAIHQVDYFQKPLNVAGFLTRLHQVQ